MPKATDITEGGSDGMLDDMMGWDAVKFFHLPCSSSVWSVVVTYRQQSPEMPLGNKVVHSVTK